MSAIPPVRFFAPAAQQAAEVNALTAAQNAAGAAATPATATVGTFSAVLGQVLAALGPLAFDTTLTNIGTGTANSGTAGGITNTVFTLLLLNSLGIGQTGTGNTTTQNAIQQLLVTQLLISATSTTDTTGLGEVTAEQAAAALAQTQPTTGNTFQTQLANVSTFPNPVLFSASVLAQAFQVGNGTGEPA